MIADILEPAASSRVPSPIDGVQEFDPVERAIIDDWMWLRTEYYADRLDHLIDRWVVVLDRRILGSGRDGHGLRIETARKEGVDPNRVVLAYIAPEHLIG